MNKSMKYIAGFLLSALLVSCATSNDPADLFKDKTKEQIYHSGKAELQNKNYTKAVQHFEALDVQYPYGADTENAQLYLIYAYYMKEDYALAAAAAERFIRVHPTHPNVDYVYYLRGLSDYYQNMGVLERLFLIDVATRDLTQIHKSWHDFNELVTLFPQSKYAPSAHQYMVYLRNVMANHELKIGQYYYNRQAYAASANRAGNIIAHYQGAPAVVDGLVLMAKSYHQLGMNKLEQDTLSVLHYNYPNVHVDYTSDYQL